MPNQAKIATPSTAAIVTLTNPRFENSSGIENANFVTMDMAIKFNGVTDELGDRVTFDRNASAAEKQSAVRNRLNDILTTYEIGVRLNNANIQIVGLPV